MKTVTAKGLKRVPVADVLFSWLDRNHTDARICPVCGEDASRSAAVNVIYTCETCSCTKASYEHLVRHLWHRKCFLKQPDKLADAKRSKP